MPRRIRIATIIGARPQYIKLSPLHREFSALGFENIVINTGQHYDYKMAGTFFKELSLPTPAFNLKVGSASASEMTSRILERCAKALKEIRPDLVAVIGDTNSTLGGALAAVQQGIPLAHIEAGLRCFDIHTPEELNRIVADKIASVLFCPTIESVENLKNEGVKNNVFLTGDVLYDVLAMMKPTWHDVYGVAKIHGLIPKQYLLITLHRADSVDRRDNLRTLVDMLLSVREDTLFPVHPRTKNRLAEFGLLSKLERSKTVRLVGPLGYSETLATILGSRMVLTDSGGIQREAYFLRIPTLLLRGVTEWVEINRAGGSMIVGFDAQKLKYGLEFRKFRFDDRTFCRTGAARRIAKRLAKFSK